MKAPFKTGDLVRSPLSKHIGIIVSVHETDVGEHTPGFLCRVHWPHKGETTQTNSIWLQPLDDASRSLIDEE